MNVGGGGMARASRVLDSFVTPTPMQPHASNEGLTLLACDAMASGYRGVLKDSHTTAGLKSLALSAPIGRTQLQYLERSTRFTYSAFV